MSKRIAIAQYWAGCPQTPNSKWKRFIHTVERCAREGWRTYLVWSRMPDDPSLAEPFTRAGCEIIIEQRARGNVDPRCVWRTYRLMCRIGCDVFHCHNVHTSPLMGAALAGVPVRIWSKLAMSSYYEQGRSPRGLHRLAPSTRLSCRLAHRVLALSDAVRDELLQQGVAGDKITVVPAPVDVPSTGNRSRDDVRIRTGLSPNDLVITCVGRAAPVKGWDLLIEAFAGVAQAITRAQLVLVGSIDAVEERPFVARLRSSVKQLGMTGRVHFLGQQKEIGPMLYASDIFAFPSRSDGQGLALTEAIAAGLPCVAAATGGIPGVITHEEDGLLFPREDVPALTTELMRLAQDTELRRRLGEAAQRSAVRFSMDTHVDMLMSHYASLLERSRNT